MPQSEPERRNAASQPLHRPSADDLIARLVEEIACATGGSIRDSAEIAVVEERLGELRTLSLAPHAPAPPPVEPVIPEAKSGGQRRPLSCVDDVILEAVGSPNTGSRRQPDPAPRRYQRPHRSRQHRSHSSFYLVALFLVCFATGVLLFNRSWFEALTSSGEYWGRDGVAATPTIEQAAVAPTPPSTPASWVRRKVKTYRVDADGAIHFEADSGSGQPAGR